MDEGNGGNGVTTGYIILETGEIFPGELLGELQGQSGEIVFNTSMIGLQEILSDPSYAGQIVVFSYPLIGNERIDNFFKDNKTCYIRGVVVSDRWSHIGESDSFQAFLQKNSIPCITNVDTRELVKTIRKQGTVGAVISHAPDGLPAENKEENYVQLVSTKSVTSYDHKGPHVVLVDFGYKRSILQSLLKIGCKVTVVPFNYPLEEIQFMQPDGIVLSNGPSSPAILSDEMQKIKTLSQRYPTLGIGLGHQLIALAYGAKIEKLRYGHRGTNHPVKDLRTGKVFITSQNHSYIVSEHTIDRNQFEVTFQHVNDQTVEGIKHKTLPIQTVQFHPEMEPGSKDTQFIFHQFIETIDRIGVVNYAIK